MIDACLGKKDDIYTFEIRPVQSLGVPGGPTGVKFFEIDNTVDVTSYVRKTGDTMSGTLKIEGSQSNLRISHIPPMGGTLNTVPLVISREKGESGSFARFQLGEKDANGEWSTQDVLKIDDKGQLDCKQQPIIHVGNANAATDAVNLRTLEDRGGELFVHKDGDTIEGDLEIKGRLDIKYRRTKQSRQ